METFYSAIKKFIITLKYFYKLYDYKLPHHCFLLKMTDAYSILYLYIFCIDLKYLSTFLFLCSTLYILAFVEHLCSYLNAFKRQRVYF